MVHGAKEWCFRASMAGSAAVFLQGDVQPPWDGWTSARWEGEEELAAATRSTEDGEKELTAATTSTEDREKVLRLFPPPFDGGCASPH